MFIRESMKRSEHTAVPRGNDSLQLRLTLKTFTVRFTLTIVFSLLIALLLQFAESPHPDNEFKTYADVKNVEMLEITKAWENLSQKLNLSISFKDFNSLLKEYKPLVRHLEITKQSRTKWSYLKSLYFTVTVITTIGYGDITPKTIIGMCLTMFAGILGIPLMVLTLKALGELIKEIIELLLKMCERLFTKKDGLIKNKEAKILALTFTFMLALILCGARLEQHNHDWTLFQGVYAWFVTMSTIGFGDFVVSKHYLQGEDNKSAPLSESAATFLFLALGLGVVASLVNALSDFFGNSKHVKNLIRACFGFRENSKAFTTKDKKLKFGDFDNIAPLTELVIEPVAEETDAQIKEEG